MLWKRCNMQVILNFIEEYKLLKFIITILTLILGLILIRIIKRIIRRNIHRINIEPSLEKFLISIITIFLYTILILFLIDQLGFPITSFIALIGSVGIAISLALQKSLSNVAAGILILINKPFKVGDYIIIGSYEGSVKSIGLFYTTITSGTLNKLSIPNYKLAEDVVTNISAIPIRRLDQKYQIAYDSDLKKAKEIIEKIIKNCEYALINDDYNYKIYVSNLLDSAVEIAVRVYAYNDNYLNLSSYLIEEIKSNFDKENIDIPYNVYDVRIKK